MRKPAKRSRAIGAAVPARPRHGLARVLSRLGVCSRAEAARRIRAGRVRVNGAIVLDPERFADPGVDAIELDGCAVRAPAPAYVMLNKPRGPVVTTSDEHGRDTVYGLFAAAERPWLAPVGRLDRASEGLLLMTNDPAWAARITDPASRMPKIYRVQVHGRPGAEALARLRGGIVDRGERLAAESIRAIGGGDRNTWYEVVLREGRNREIRRLFAALGCEVLRLIRIAIGPVVLGDLPRGAWRPLTDGEVAGLARPGASPPRNANSRTP